MPLRPSPERRWLCRCRGVPATDGGRIARPSSCVMPCSEARQPVPNLATVQVACSLPLGYPVVSEGEGRLTVPTLPRGSLTRSGVPKQNHAGQRYDMKCKHCSRPKLPDSDYCGFCRANKSRAKSQNRKIWRESKLCVECGQDPLPNTTLCQKHTIALTARKDKYRREVKLAALRHYSSGDPKCSCCGETETDFLTIDHIAGGGNKHRKEVGGIFTIWLRKQGYPEGYRVLCFNCNIARGLFGTCPHERLKPQPLVADEQSSLTDLSTSPSCDERLPVVSETADC